MKLRIAKAASVANANYVFLGIPTDLGAKSVRKGRVAAPKQIRALSDDRFISLEGSVDESKIFDMGDVKLTAKDIHKNIAAIKNSALKIFSEHKTLISFGGDCSVKYGLLSALNEVHKNISVIYIDSHPDLEITDKPYYGSVMADCLRLKNIDFERSVFVGIRDIEACEMDLLEEKKMHYFSTFDTDANTVEKVFQKIKKIVKGNTVYIALDTDAIDPAFAPAVGCVTPGGISSTEILALINKLKRLDPVGLDITEYIPRYDIGDMTGKLLFRIIHDFIAR